MCYCKSLTPVPRFVQITYGTLFNQFSHSQSPKYFSLCLLSKKTYSSRVKSTGPPLKLRLRHPFTQRRPAVQRETVGPLFRITQQCNPAVSKCLTCDKFRRHESASLTAGLPILLHAFGITNDSCNKSSGFEKQSSVDHFSNRESYLVDPFRTTCGYDTQYLYGLLISPVLAQSSLSTVGAILNRKQVPGHLSINATTHLSVRYFRYYHFSRRMAKSKFEYVRQFEIDDPCLQNCWLVVRIDGKAFHKFTDTHHFMKPNDERGLSLMTRAAQTVMGEFNEIVLAYGQSDEYSFVFHKNCKLYNRRARFFNAQELQYPPSFDARVVLYPSDENLKDYLSWRQADCHINNLYNTCFWKLVQEKGLTPNKAAERLKGTLSSDKNELLFSEFSINYNNLPELYRKGTVLIRTKSGENGSPSPDGSINNHTMRSIESKTSKKPGSIILHTDIIGKKFWEDNPHILGPKM